MRVWVNKYVNYFRFLFFFADLGVRGVEPDRVDSLSLWEVTLSVPAPGGWRPFAALIAASEGVAGVAGPEAGEPGNGGGPGVPGMVGRLRALGGPFGIPGMAGGWGLTEKDGRGTFDKFFPLAP